MLGIGDLADRPVPLEQCVATVRRAMDAGLNVIDTAPGYEDGYSEQIVGAGRSKGRRDGMFVIDKIDHLDEPGRPAGRRQPRAAGPGRTRTCSSSTASRRMDDWRQLTAPGGGMDQLAELRQGRARRASAASPAIIPTCCGRPSDSGLCDVVLFPVGPYCDERYVDEILPLARRQGVGTVCFKTFGAGKLLGDTTGYGRPLAGRGRAASSAPAARRPAEPPCCRT